MQPKEGSAEELLFGLVPVSVCPFVLSSLCLCHCIWFLESMSGGAPHRPQEVKAAVAVGKRRFACHVMSGLFGFARSSVQRVEQGFPFYAAWFAATTVLAAGQLTVYSLLI